MKRYFIHLAYNGARYCGWQIQPHSPSVQEELERCLTLKTGQKISVTGCGRTDTGVHARNYYAHFDVETPIANCQDLVYRLNVFLPPDIVLYKIWEVPADLHARFNAVSRTYHYYISRQKNPFHQQDAYFLYGDLDVEKMQQAADLLFNYHDFTSFSKLHTQVKTNDCKIMEARWFELDGLLVFRIRADRFLRNMVRAIVGTLLEVGKGRMTLEQFKEVIEKKNRCSAGESVPAHALFLEAVEYSFVEKP
jgi:tRNA pseudouridine38-40 synthase